MNFAWTQPLIPKPRVNAPVVLAAAGTLNMNNLNIGNTLTATANQKAVSGQVAVLHKAVEATSIKTDETQVAIGGKAMMLSRLFNESDSSSSPTFKTAGRDNADGLVFDFLTATDRDMLSSAYSVAAQSGVDPRYVDDVAFDLACYRQSPGGIGDIYDDGGHKLGFDFSADDAAVSNRITNSASYSNSRLDKGFLQHELSAQSGSHGYHTADFSFLEKLIDTFASSDPQAKGMVFDQAYALPKHDGIVTHSSDVQITMPPVRIPNAVGDLADTVGDALSELARLEPGAKPKTPADVLNANRLAALVLLERYTKAKPRD